jgi:hypothetical protein
MGDLEEAYFGPGEVEGRTFLLNSSFGSDLTRCSVDFVNSNLSSILSIFSQPNDVRFVYRTKPEF